MTFKKYYSCGFHLLLHELSSHLLFFPSYILLNLTQHCQWVHSSHFFVGLSLKHIFLTFGFLLAYVPENTSNMINQLLIFFSCSLY